MDEQLSFTDALDKRAEVLDGMAEKHAGWVQLAIDGVEGLPIGWEGTGEDIRFRLIEEGLAAPRHHNAWGTVIGGARRSGLLARTGEWRPMRGDKAHGRETRVYRRVVPEVVPL